MSNDKMCEEFEAWAFENGMAMHLARAESGLYVSRVTQNYMGCWMASRAAVVVELPPAPELPEDPEEAIDDGHMDAYHSAVRMRKACAKSVEAAGLQVKP